MKSSRYKRETLLKNNTINNNNHQIRSIVKGLSNAHVNDHFVNDMFRVQKYRNQLTRVVTQLRVTHRIDSRPSLLRQNTSIPWS